MKLIPAVKDLQFHEGALHNRALKFPDQNVDPRIAALFSHFPTAEDGTPVYISAGEENEESYRLYISEHQITIDAAGAAGAFYALQTLRQIYAQGHIPCLTIMDQPDFSFRGFYHDITRGKISTVATIKELIDRMAYYKLNSLQLYVEHVFPFKETEDLIGATGCITAEELLEIKAYCHANFIDFIPSLSTFGHMYELLQQPRYQHLRVLKDYEKVPNFWHERMKHHTVDPLHPESIALVQSLIDQYAPLFDSEYFNICCDETFDLHSCAQSPEEVGKIYLDFVQKIISHVSAKGRKIMMWADILLEHPETITALPEDTWFLNWYYWANFQEMERRISTFAKLGRTQIVCPGTCSWNRFCEGLAIGEHNICGMAEIGHRYGAKGVLNTNWGDWGHLSSMEMVMYGLVLGAEKSWSVHTKVDDRFYDNVNFLLYGCDNGVQMLKAVSAMQDRISWRDVADNYFTLRHQIDQPLKPVAQEDIEAILTDYVAIRDTLSQQHWQHDEFRQEMLIAAEGICLMAQLAARQFGYPLKPVTDAVPWMDKYRDSWIRQNKINELENVLAVFQA